MAITTRAATEPLRCDPAKLRAIRTATLLDQEMVETRSWLRRLVLDMRRHFLRYYWMRPPLWRVLLRALWNRDRMLPSFVSVGPVRSGTTLLSDYVMQHPCVVLPLAKEIGLEVVPTLALLRAQFPTRAQERRVEQRYGRAITGFGSPAVPNLLFPFGLSAVAPDVKFVVLLRDPVERTFAHWRWERLCAQSVKDDPLWKHVPDFAESVRLEIEAARSGATSGFTYLSGANCGGYVQHSIYLPFLNLLVDRFGREQVLVLDSGEFFAEPAAVARRIYEFLDLPDYEPVLLNNRNPGPRGEMDPETRRLLAEFFAPLNRKLFDFIGQEFLWQ